MKIIIAGAGEVGFYLSEMLAMNHHDIVVIDTNREVLRLVESHTDLMTIEGSATSIQTLHEANVDRADLLLAVTQSQETNIVISALGKQLGAKNTIARVENSEYLNEDSGIDFTSLGIDSMIYPNELATTEIVWLIEQAAARNAFEFDNGKLTLLEMTIEEHAPVVDKSVLEVAQMYADIHFRIVAVVRKGETIIPKGHDKIHAGDLIFVIAETVGIDEIITITGHQKIKIKDVMILGGSRLGFKAAQRLAQDFSVKLIEADRNKCERLAGQLSSALVLHGDGRDTDLLRNEGIGGMDAFIALTGDTETNILSCLSAKRMGVKKTIALVENMGYMLLSQNLGIDTVINKKLIAASHIFSFIRKGEIVSLMNFSDADAEAVEYIVKPGTKITRKPIKDLGFPQGAIIGGVIRDDHSFITVGDSRIRGGDRVVVFTKPEAIDKVEAFFH